MSLLDTRLRSEFFADVLCICCRCCGTPRRWLTACRSTATASCPAVRCEHAPQSHLNHSNTTFPHSTLQRLCRHIRIVCSECLSAGLPCMAGGPHWMLDSCLASSEAQSAMELAIASCMEGKVQSPQADVGYALRASQDLLHMGAPPSAVRPSALGKCCSHPINRLPLWPATTSPGASGSTSHWRRSTHVASGANKTKKC